jgi:hypothetical protein
MSVNPYHTHTLTDRTPLVWRCIQETYLYSHARNYIHIYKEHNIKLCNTSIHRILATYMVHNRLHFSSMKV